MKKSGSTVPVLSTKTGSLLPLFVMEKAEVQCTKSGSALPTEPFEEPSEEPFEEPSEGKSLVPKPNSARRKASKTIPENCPSNSDLEWAEKHLTDAGRSDLAGSLSDIAARFRDHHLSKGSRFADWSAAWRTWTRNEVKFSKPQPARGRGMSAVEGILTANLNRGGW